jgi:hypothetical protein
MAEAASGTPSGVKDICGQCNVLTQSKAQKILFIDPFVGLRTGRVRWQTVRWCPKHQVEPQDTVEEEESLY